MNDGWFMRVQISKRIKELIRPKQNPAQRKWFLSTFKPFCKIIAGDVLHDKILFTVFGEMIAHFWQDRVAKPRKCPGFPFKGPPEHLIVSKECPLQSDRAPQSLVDREVNFTHPSFPNEMDN